MCATGGAFASVDAYVAFDRPCDSAAAGRADFAAPAPGGGAFGGAASRDPSPSAACSASKSTADGSFPLGPISTAATPPGGTLTGCDDGMFAGAGAGPGTATAATAASSGGGGAVSPLCMTPRAGGSVSIGIARSSDDPRFGFGAATATGATGEIPDATCGARGVCGPFTARGGSGGALPGGFPIPGSVPALTGAAF